MSQPSVSHSLSLSISRVASRRVSQRVRTGRGRRTRIRFIRVKVLLPQCLLPDSVRMWIWSPLMSSVVRGLRFCNREIFDDRVICNALI